MARTDWSRHVTEREAQSRRKWANMGLTRPIRYTSQAGRNARPGPVGKEESEREATEAGNPNLIRAGRRRA